MKAIIDIHLRIMEGEDEGYVLDEQNRIINLHRVNNAIGINPYRLTLEFITPDIMREWREAERE